MSKNDPALLSRIVQGMAKQSSHREFYADGEALAPVLEKSGLSPEALETILPGVTWAIRTNGSVRIPVEAFAAHPFLKKVLPDARIAPGAMSQAEAQALVRQHAENIERQVKTGADRQAEDETGHPGANEAEPQGAGKTETESTGAARSGNARSAEQLYNKLLKLNELAENSPLRQSDPTRFAQEVQKILGPNPGRGFYVNGRVLLGALRADCKARKDYSLLANLPSIEPELASQLPKAIEANGDVLVPFNTFAGHFAGKMDDLLQFAKPATGMPGHAEAQALRKGEPNPAENHGKTGAESWGITHPPLPPEQVQVPGGGLRAMEHIGGHVLEKHVGKTEQELLKRLTNEPDIKGSSSFYNEAVAEEAIAAALKANDAGIKAWLTSGNVYHPPFEVTLNKPVGIVVSKGSTSAVPSYRTRVALKRDPLSPLGYYIITGHPIP